MNDVINAPASELVVAPAVSHMVGKTLTDKRLSIVSTTSDAATLMLASSMGGKVGKAAAQTTSGLVAHMLARNILSGNYKPAADALSLKLGQAVAFGHPDDAPKGETSQQLAQRMREDWDAFGRDMRKAMSSMAELTKTGKVPPARQRAIDTVALWAEVQASIRLILEERAAKRAEREAAEAAQKS